VLFPRKQCGKPSLSPVGYFLEKIPQMFKPPGTVKKLRSDMKNRVRKTTGTQLGMICILWFINKKKFLLLFIRIMSVSVTERSQDD
jgi:hypothetical protein